MVIIFRNDHIFCFSGQPPAEADLNLLETARRCELYGTKMHPAKVSKTNKFQNDSFRFTQCNVNK